MPSNPRELLEKRKRAERDLETLRYRRPRGESLHVVADALGNERILGAVAPGTWSPGNQVLIGSESGGRAKEIIGLPQSGARRGGAFPPIDISQDLSTPGIVAVHPPGVPFGAVDFRIL